MRAGHAEAPIGPRRQNVASATLITFATNVTVAVFSLVNVLIVARYLGPSGRGDVAFLTAIAWFTSNLATAGVEESVANFAATEPHLRRRLATNSIVFSLLLGALAVGVVAGLVELFPAVGGESSSDLRWLTLGSLPLLILGVYLRSLVRADYGFAVTNIAWLVTPVGNLIVNGLLAALDLLTVGTAVTTWLAGQAAYTVILAWYVQRRLAGFGRPDVRLMGRTLAFGLKTHAGRVMLLGNYRLDQWLLGAISGSRELGLYSIAVAWAEALWFLPTALAFVQRPDLVRAGRREAGRQTAIGFRAAALITTVFALAMVAAAPFLCVTVFGDEFRGSIVELRILVIGAIGVLALKVFGNALVAQGKPVLSSVALGSGFVITVVLDVLLIPPYAGIGASLASTIAYTGAGGVMALFFVRALEARAGDLVPRGSDLPRFLSEARSSLRRFSRAARPQETTAD